MVSRGGENNVDDATTNPDASHYSKLAHHTRRRSSLLTPDAMDFRRFHFHRNQMTTTMLRI
jgi:hypothetical protein